jgi:imidazolonepropionase-like amidohydrolase
MSVTIRYLSVPNCIPFIMRKCLPFFIFLLPIVSFCQTTITNVTVVDVVNKKMIPAQTVTFDGNIITKIQAAKGVKIPKSATVIDGSGKFLMPGMTDSHVHFFQSGGLYARPDALDLRKEMPYEKENKWVHDNMEDFLRRYTSVGITSVIDVGATVSFLNQRKQFADKDFAPNIYMTGPLLTSWEPPVYAGLKDEEPFSLVKTIEDGRQMVQNQLPFHPDFIKIWYIIDHYDPEKSAKAFQPVAKAIIDEAHKNNLKVAVHATERITAQLAVESGCDFLVHDVEDEVVDAGFVKLLKDKKTILCPTLIVAGNYDNTFAQNDMFNTYDLRTSNPTQLGSLSDLKHLSDTIILSKYKSYFRSKEAIAALSHSDSIRRINLKKMADGGVTIAAGTDAGNIGTQHASSYIKELSAMQSAGMNTWQIIQSATINPMKILNMEATAGSITVGKKAEMILLDANPLENLENLTKINLVINKGKIFKPDSLIADTPVSLVMRQLNGYNARNIDAFLEPYDDEVELYIFPDKLIGKGKEAMRTNYSNFFNSTPDLHCEVKSRIIRGNVIIDNEHVILGKGQTMDAIAIYHIENGKIKKVYFID